MPLKKIKISLRSEIPNFPLNEEINSIEQELNNYIKILEPKMNTQELNGWRVLIIVVIRNTDAVGAFKRSRRYPSDHEYEMSISIPIPDEKQASYGSYKANEGFFSALNDRFYIFAPNFKDYNSLYEYITETSKQAIHLLFRKGVVCGGKRIKFQEQ